ncbi:MAG: hypothetical protein DRJ98_04125 [Thermoprotei archaeon]|nr:MAG: hypothetical protein DRJ98_04125 [Thermoprotei archaeon]
MYMKHKGNPPIPPLGELGKKAINVIVAALLFRSAFWIHLEFNLVENLPGLLSTLLLYAIAFILLVEAFTDLRLVKTTRIIAAAAAISFVLSFAVSSQGSPHYGTDATIFTRYAVELLLSGENPYAHSMHPALIKYAMDYRWLTQTLEGASITTYSYPSLSFLIYVPAFMVGFNDVGGVMVFFFLLTALFLAFETPSEYRLLPILIMFLDPMLLILSYVGTHDIIWAFFLLLSMKFFNPSSSKDLSISAIFLGLAMAVKQIPWLILPFLLIWLFKRKGLKETVLYGVYALIVFLLPNLPFIVWDFESWLRGVLTPVVEPLTPMGYGLVSLVYEGYLYLPKIFFTVATVAAALTLLVLYWLNFERVKYLAWIVPAFVLFFSWRSLQNYFIFFIPIAYYAALMMVKERVSKAT